MKNIFLIALGIIVIVSCSKSENNPENNGITIVKNDTISDGYNLMCTMNIAVVDKLNFNPTDAKNNLMKIAFYADAELKKERRFPAYFDYPIYVNDQKYEIDDINNSIRYDISIFAPGGANKFGCIEDDLYSIKKNDTIVWCATSYLKLYNNMVDTIYTEVSETMNWIKLTKLVYNGVESPTGDSFMREIK